MSSRRMAFGAIVVLALFTAGHSVGAVQPAPALTFTKLWTHSHDTPGQVAEIAKFDPRTNTIWIAGIVGVDVLNADTGALVEHIDVTSHGAVNSVAIHNGLAAFAVEAASQSAIVQFAEGTYVPPGEVRHKTYRPQVKADLSLVEQAVELLPPNAQRSLGQGSQGTQGPPRASTRSDYFEIRGRLRLQDRVVEERALVVRNQLEVIPLQRERLTALDSGPP